MRLAISVFSLAILTGSTGLVSAEPMQLKMLSNYSRTTFKTDAPLETIVGNAVAAAVTGGLVVDPARPREAKGTVTVDMSKVRTGIDKRDADMLDPRFLDAGAAETNKLVTFEITGVEIAGPLEPGKERPAKIRGTFTAKQKPIEVVADGRVVWIRLTPEQVESQKRFGFTSDQIKVRARFGTLFTNHGMQVPQLLFLKVSNEIEIETDLTFARQ